MQSNCQKLKLPFEVLIQGPSGNQFVRKLVTEAETSMPMQDSTLIRRARSTVSIYQPDEKKSDVSGGASVPASAVTNQAVVPPATESKPKQSAVASLSKQKTTTDATAEKPDAGCKKSPPEATAPATEKIVTEPKTATPNKGTEKSERDAPLRQKRQDEVAASVMAPAVAPAAEEVAPAAAAASVDASAVNGASGNAAGAKAADEDTAMPDSARAAGDETAVPGGEPEVGSTLGLPPPLFPLLPFGTLPVLGAIKPAIGLAAIKAEAAKNLALVKAGVATKLAAAKVGAPLVAVGGPLAAAKAAVDVHLAAIRAKLPILPAII